MKSELVLAGRLKLKYFELSEHLRNSAQFLQNLLLDVAVHEDLHVGFEDVELAKNICFNKTLVNT